MIRGKCLRDAAKLSVVLLSMACSTSTPVPPLPSLGATSTTAAATSGPATPAGTAPPGDTGPPARTAAPGDTGAPPETIPPVSPEPSAPPSAQAGLLLTEVRFLPLPGDPAFVEVSNTSSTAIEVSGTILRLGTNDLPLSGHAEPLAAGEQLLVLFDSLGTTDGMVVHAPAGYSVPADTGSVSLLDAAGASLDRVAWGDAQPDAVQTGPGGIVPAEFSAGETIGRAPGVTSRGSSDDWVVNAAADASPGQPNRMPTVSVLLPLSGAILDIADANLFWYPVPGAVSYRVQVASEPTFASPAFDTTTTEPQVNVGTLAAGAYSWRAQAVATDGTASRFSAAANLDLVTATSATGPADIELAAIGGAGLSAIPDDPGKHLSVPLLSQHKDTAMLLLERNREKGAHPWDADHGALDRRDPADNKNCALATVAMVSKFYGGNLSQDRLGYELLQQRKYQTPGPEGDLIYGHGITGQETSDALTFALGGAVVAYDMTSYAELWKYVVAELDAGRPLAAANSHHGFVITGYEVKAGHRRMTVNDPWPGRTMIQDLERSKVLATDITIWLMPASPVVRQQESGVTSDSDGDGVVDFDETERFHTNPNRPDTDGDKVRDKQDIVAGVFDPRHGYASNPENPGRDWDGDGVPSELDSDSDAGDCLDGEEDTNRDGHRNGKETWNFDRDDDTCGGWRGTISVDVEMTLYDGVTVKSGLTVHVRLAPIIAGSGAASGQFVDAGSTYAYRETGGGNFIDPCVSQSVWTSIGNAAFIPDGFIALDLAAPPDTRADLTVQGDFTTRGTVIIGCEFEQPYVREGGFAPTCGDSLSGLVGQLTPAGKIDFKCTGPTVTPTGSGTITVTGTLTRLP